MPQAELKANEIGSELIDLLQAKSSITEMEFYRYIKDIEKLKDRVSEDYLKALANGVYGRKDIAIDFFEASLKQNSDIFAQNYVVYLNDYGTFRETRDLVNRLVPQYGSRTMIGHAWETNLFMGDIDKALYFANKFISIVDESEGEKMSRIAASALKDTTEFKQTVGITDEDYKDLANRVVDVMDAYHVKPRVLEFFSVPEEQTSSYIMFVNSDDIDILSDMNLDIAFSLAENDNLVGKKFSVWFKGNIEEDADAGQ
ncbi:hypothetical protein [Enterobacter sp. R4-368]|uniref:hypothetical protein n=1 Tax=Enterobacter sp. R4-368 TaxID=1166130 RepID=UPI00034EF4B4|nr:hypothetical protein [Enterobacter sp. R4-368]AGN84939.1 hypothetical protein H650_07015 [Enterobacter sp. R4-368]